MVKLLAWVVLGLSLMFVILAFTALFGLNSLGAETAALLVWWGAIPLAVVALLVTLAILVIGGLTSESSES